MKISRVALVSHSSLCGGAERCLLETVKGLARLGISCYVALPGPGPLVEELQQRGIPTRQFPYCWWCGLEPRWRLLRSGVLGRNTKTLRWVYPLVRQLQTWKVDVVLSNTITIPVGALAAFVLSKPHVWHVHEFGREDHGLRFDLGFRLSAEIVSRLSEFVIVNSKALAAFYSRYVPPRQLRLAYYGVEVTPSAYAVGRETPAGAPTRLVLVGTKQPGKGQMDAIKATAHLASLGLPVQLTLVGPGQQDYIGKLKRAVSENGLDEVVRFTEYVAEPAPMFSASDIVLMCSRSEAFGRVTVEAMKSSKPVVGARAGATTELIRDNFNGLLYTPGDHRDLASKIGYLIEHPIERKRMGDNAMLWANKEFTVEKYAAVVASTLEEACAATATERLIHMEIDR